MTEHPLSRASARFYDGTTVEVGVQAAEPRARRPWKHEARLCMLSRSWPYPGGVRPQSCVSWG
eukprot:654834-Prymnesium_polylepis.1